MADTQDRRIAILGGGITGLSAAYYLLREGANVTLFESSPKLGGLASTFDFGDFFWDRFYHCILTSDKSLLQLIEDLGLTQELRWQQTKVGFYTAGALYSMSTMRDFLTFPGISIWNKLRLALGILYVCSLRDGSKLEEIKLSTWMIRVFGNSNYRAIWEPLLKCKLGASREEASAAFMWATITRLYSTRDKDRGRQERLGYVTGGYRTICDRLCQEIQRLGGDIRLGAQVERVRYEEGRLQIAANSNEESFDSVISTIPSKVLAQIAPDLSPEYVAKLNGTKYLGIVCFVLVLKQSLSPYYVTNLSIDDVPFTGIIEMSNLVASGDLACHHLVYLPKYTVPGDPLFELPEEELWTAFQRGLLRIFPNLSETVIERRFLFRERFVQPLPALHYSATLPAMNTAVPGLILANSTQIINSTLNNNAMVKIAWQAVEMLKQENARTSLLSNSYAESAEAVINSPA